jgi:hypothetical protein
MLLILVAPETRGVFRIPGSVRVVNELYDFYSAQGDEASITGTIRSPNLPVHIKSGVHDVASAFKKLLAGLPGGILGHLSVFDALVAIHSQLHGDPEFNRTKRSKVRARLMALVVGTIKSQLRRELVCAVFGLLCLVGRSAEVAPREDGQGRPLPTSDLMGYSALGIIFGPLLLGDCIDSYSMALADPTTGLVVLPLTPPKSRNSRRRKSSISESQQSKPLNVDKILVANDIAEMLITHWRDVVKHMKSLDLMRRHSMADQISEAQGVFRRPSGDSLLFGARASALDRYPPSHRLSRGTGSPVSYSGAVSPKSEDSRRCNHRS